MLVGIADDSRGWVGAWALSRGGYYIFGYEQRLNDVMIKWISGIDSARRVSQFIISKRNLMIV